MSTPQIKSLSVTQLQQLASQNITLQPILNILTGQATINYQGQNYYTECQVFEALKTIYSADSTQSIQALNILANITPVNITLPTDCINYNYDSALKTTWISYDVLANLPQKFPFLLSIGSQNFISGVQTITYDGKPYYNFKDLQLNLQSHLHLNPNNSNTVIKYLEPLAISINSMNSINPSPANSDQSPQVIFMDPATFSQWWHINMS